MDDPGFTALSSCQIAIVGLGLMGGSLALALDGRCRAILGVDSDPETCARARGLGIFARVSADLDDALPDADLVVLATPVRTLLAQIGQIAGQAIGIRKPRCLLDLGSTKAQVVAAMRRLPEGWQAVGGHPLCGKEVAGLAAAERGLFAGQQFCLSPVPGRTHAPARRLAEELARAIGARPLWLEAEVHDRLLAVTSHLPYVLAVALAVCGGAAQTQSPVVAQLAASGFRDTSRLAASNVTVMADTLATNRAAVLQALDRCTETLAELRALLASGADDDLAARLAEARAARLALYSRGGQPQGQPQGIAPTRNTIEIAPISRPLAATVAVPGSKSLTNRALAAAALAEGVTRLVHPLIADDTRYFIEALLRLGFRIESEPEAVVVHGLGGRIPAQRAELFVGNAGTAARFLTALVTVGKGEYLIDGSARMRQRPIADLLRALRALGAEVESVNDTGCPPVRVRARGLRGGAASVAGDTSSQFLSALLLAAPYASAPVELVVEHGLNSGPFVDLTLAVMADFGVEVERDDYDRFRVRPARYRPCAEYVVEGDASAASYFFAAPAILGGCVKVQNVGRKSGQGDLRFLDVLAEMGCAVRVGDDGVEVRGPRGELRGVEVDLRHMSDMAMTLAAIAPFAATPTAIRGIASSRLKETDRVAAMCAELARLGVPVSELPDGLIIQPCQNIRPGVIQTYGDHRMAMAFALVGLRVAGIQIADPGCVSKTFPDYFEALEQLR